MPQYPFQGSGGLRASQNATITGNWTFNGTVTFAGTVTSSSDIVLGSSNYLGWSTDLKLYRDAAGVLAQRNGANAQMFRVYNTDDGAGNAEWITLLWDTNVAYMGSSASGTGVLRGLHLVGGNGAGFGIGVVNAAVDNWAIDASGNLVAGTDNAFDIGASGATRPRSIYIGSSALTSGTMTQAVTATLRRSVSKFTWTNAQVVALGASLTGDITVCTLPAKTIVLNAYLIVDSTAAGVTSLTGALGRTGAGYIDYIVASDLKVAANTVYGDASGERGTNLTGYDLPSYTGTTDVKVHFISTVENLDQTTGCTGTVILETATLP